MRNGYKDSNTKRNTLTDLPDCHHLCTVETPSLQVRLQEQDHWKPAVILQPATTAHSYIPHTQDRQVCHRNSRHLWRSKEQQGRSDNNTSSAEEAAEHEEDDNASDFHQVENTPHTPERHTTGNTSHTHDTHTLTNNFKKINK